MSGSALGRNALVVLAAIAVGATLYWLQGILTPLAVAVFLAIMVDGFARFLTHRARLPAWAAMPGAVGILVLGVIAVLAIVADNSVGFATQLVRDAPRLNTVIASIAGLFGVKVPPTVAGLIDQLNPSRYLGTLMGALQSFGAATLYSLIYLGFLIASRSGFKKKAVALFPHAHERHEAQAVFVRIRNGVEGYLWIQTVTGAAMALLSGIAMAALGLQNAVFWAFLIFIASYIPILGGLVGSTLPPVFALLQFEAYWRAILLFGLLQVIFFVVGSVVQPRMQRDSLNIDPVVVLLSLAFWGAVWGVAGMFLSTPLTVMAIIILAQFPGSRWIAILLSGDGDPQGAAKAAVAGRAPAGSVSFPTSTEKITVS
jgi:AI-2 transport protein TqsA